MYDSKIVMQINITMLCMYLVSCPTINEILDGAVDCEFESNATPSIGETCSFTCNTGYEITGSDTRTCQSDGSWSGTATMCRRGTYVYLSVLVYMNVV